MKSISIKNSLVLILLLLSSICEAQDVEMADSFRADGKIYVVIAVASIVLFVISAFIINLDRKVTRLEKKINPEKK